MDIYSHVLPGIQRDAARKFEDLDRDGTYDDVGLTKIARLNLPGSVDCGDPFFRGRVDGAVRYVFLAAVGEHRGCRKLVSPPLL